MWMESLKGMKTGWPFLYPKDSRKKEISALTRPQGTRRCSTPHYTTATPQTPAKTRRGGNIFETPTKRRLPRR